MKIDIKSTNTKKIIKAKSAKKESLVTENLIDLSQFVRSYRKKNSLTQDELAKYSNVSRLAISEFERL